MTQSLPRTPGIPLLSVGLLCVAALMAIFAPFLLAVLLLPGYVVTAVLGYTRSPFAPYIGLGATALLLLSSIGAFLLAVTTHVGVGLPVWATISLLWHLANVAVGATGSGLLFARRTIRPSSFGREEAGRSAYPQAQCEPYGTPAGGQGAPSQERATGHETEDLKHVGKVLATGAGAAVTGAGKAWSSWRAGAPRRSARRAREREKQLAEQAHYAAKKREREEAEIHKANLRRARQENNPYSLW